MIGLLIFMHHLSTMIELKLPTYDTKVKKEGDKLFIFDLIRKKFVALIPEEWVRQHLLNYLIVFKKYPKGLFKIESQHHYHTMAKRTDLLIYDTEAKPWMLAECKSPDVKISASSINQISVYNKTIKAQYLLLCNGIEMYCWKADHESPQYELLKELPEFVK
jgi:hypothetical protein